MKKLFVLGLLIVFVLGMSTVALASNAKVDLDVSLEVEPYCAVYDVGDCFDEILGLWADTPIGAPGLYISDGGATYNYSQSLWGNLGNPVNDTYDEAGFQYVEKFMIDANMDVNVTLEWTDPENWAPVPSFFRVSTHHSLPYNDISADCDNKLLPMATGIGNNWNNTPAAIANRQEEYNGIVIADLVDWNTNLGLTDSFTLLREACQGPVLYHLNGGLYLPKADLLDAGADYSAQLQITVACING